MASEKKKRKANKSKTLQIWAIGAIAKMKLQGY